MHRIPIAILALTLVAAPAVAAPPDATTIFRQMKAALEPAQPSTRKFDMLIRSPEGETTHWVARQARKHLKDGNRILTVLLEPAEVRGVALLIQERHDQPALQWMYLPTIRRVRKIVYAGGYEPFLGTDFSYADLGFFNLRDRSFKLLGSETFHGVDAYKVQEMPRNRWYFSRIVTWVAADSKLPLERDYYDPAGALWKIEHFDDITTVDGVPTPLKIRMDDAQENASSELDVSDVRYGVDVPDALFDPLKLREVAEHPLWKAPSK